MSYVKALEQIQRSGRKTLVEGEYRRADGKCCALGALLPATRTLDRRVNGSQIDDILGLVSYGRSSEEVELFVDADDRAAIRANLAALDLTADEASMLQYENDFVGPIGETPAERFVRVVAWLEAKVAEERKAAAQ